MKKERKKREYDSPYTEITRFDSDIITISDKTETDNGYDDFGGLGGDEDDDDDW